MTPRAPPDRAGRSRSQRVEEPWLRQVRPRKVLGALGSLAFMLVVNFFLFRVLPGDPARTLGRGRFTNQEQIEAFNKTYGLDEPLPQQFLTYLKNTRARRPRASR